MLFGQVVIGPPGSGKSTYCQHMKEFLTGIKRRVIIVNLDPANENLPFDADVDIRDLVTLDDVMDHFKLGPNGGLVYCMEFLCKNAHWLREQLSMHTTQRTELPPASVTPSTSAISDSSMTSSNTIDKPAYIFFDFPGQVELYTHTNCVRDLLKMLQSWNYHLTVVQLMDSLYCTDPAKFIAVLLTALNSMIQLEMPHINVLSKGDLLLQRSRLEELPFDLEYFTEVMDLNYLLDLLEENTFLKKFNSLNKAICGVIEDYSLVSFYLLNITDSGSMLKVLSAADKANGYCFGDGEERSLKALLGTAFSSTPTGSTKEEVFDLLQKLKAKP